MTNLVIKIDRYSLIACSCVMMSQSNRLACCIFLEKNLQNCHYGTLCFALMGFLVCGKKIFLPPSNFWISCHDKNRTDCTVSALSYIFFLRFSSAQRSMCQKPSVFSGFHNGPFMGCNNSPWLTTQMMSRRQRLNTEAPACNRSRKNKRKHTNQKLYHLMFHCVWRYRVVSVVSGLLAERRCGIFKELANIKGEVVLVVVAGGVAGGRGSPSGPIQAWERTGTGGQTSL